MAVRPDRQGPLSAGEGDSMMDDTVIVQAWQCPYRPEDDKPAPIGMYHCPDCSCVVVSRLEHGVCLEGLCPAVDEGDHPGQPIQHEMTRRDAEMLGLV